MRIPEKDDCWIVLLSLCIFISFSAFATQNETPQSCENYLLSTNQLEANAVLKSTEKLPQDFQDSELIHVTVQNEYALEFRMFSHRRGGFIHASLYLIQTACDFSNGSYKAKTYYPNSGTLLQEFRGPVINSSRSRQIWKSICFDPYALEKLERYFSLSKSKRATLAELQKILGAVFVAIRKSSKNLKIPDNQKK